MEEQVFSTPETTVYRQVNDELVVIQLDSGYFYFFNPSTKQVLDYFKTPKSLGAFLKATGTTSKVEKEKLKKFCDLLLKDRLIAEVEAASDESAEEVQLTIPPALIRKGEKTLDELTFLCP